ncbi:MAG: CNNM domain-containing protein, partial [FCB group bacterium]
MILNILFTLLLVCLNAFFVAAEFAIVTVRISQIELRIRTGSKLAKIAMNIILHLDSYLSATQLGITLASLGLGWIGESIVAEIIRNIMSLFGLHLTNLLSHQIALPVAFLTITILQIIFGELLPKWIAIQRPEKLSLTLSIPLKIFYYIFRPFIWVLNKLANVLI